MLIKRNETLRVFWISDMKNVTKLHIARCN